MKLARVLRHDPVYSDQTNGKVPTRWSISVCCLVFCIVGVADTSCATPCASLLYNEGDYQEEDWMMRSVITISLPLNVFMFATWLMFKRQQTYVMSYVVVSLVLTMVIFVCSWHPWLTGRHVVEGTCQNNTDPYYVLDGGTACSFYHLRAYRFTTPFATIIDVLIILVVCCARGCRDMLV